MRFAKPWRRWHDAVQRRLSWRSSALTLNRRNLYILPSRFGVLWALSAALLYLVGINSRSNGPVLLSLLLLGLQGLSLFLTHANLQGLELQCMAGNASCADEPAPVLLQVRSQRNRLRISVRWREPAEHNRPQSLELQAGRSSLPMPWFPARRGVQPPGRLLIETSAPLGLFRCWSVWEPPLRLTIAPARRAGAVRELQSPNHSGPMGALGRAEGSEAFVELTPWRPEQGLQRVAWKAMARGQGWYSKRFSSDQPEQTWLAPDRSLPREQALEHVCERLCHRLAQGDSIGLVLPDGIEIPPGSGDGQRQRCLQALAEVPPGEWP